MAVVCTGPCFGNDDQGRLALNLAPSPWDCSSLNGQPIYCDENNQLRGAPLQSVSSQFYSENTPGFIFTPANGTPADVCHTFSVQINNPDSCRRMSGIGIWTLRADTTLQPDSQIRVSGGGDFAHEYRNDDAAAKNLFHEVVRTSQINIAPGGSQTLQITLCTERTAGASDTFSMRAQLRIMAIGSTAT